MSTQSDKMEVITTKRGAPCLLQEGFRFRQDRTGSKCITWRCCNVDCKSRCATDLQLQQITKEPSEHNHEKLDERAMDLERVRTSSKRKAIENVTESAGKIVCEEAAKTNSISNTDIIHLKNTVYRERLKDRFYIGGVPGLLKSSTGKKRPADTGDFTHEMQKMLEGFGDDISKTMVQKKKKMEQHTQVTLKNANKRVEELWTSQQEARSKLQDEFSKQVSAVCTQWESDIEKSREQEEKINNLFKQQLKMFQQTRIVQTQRLKTIKELSEQFVRGLEDLDQSRKSQQASLQSELKKEMALLQKKIIMDTQQQDMANVRKSLHSMLF